MNENLNYDKLQNLLESDPTRTKPGATQELAQFEDELTELAHIAELLRADKSPMPQKNATIRAKNRLNSALGKMEPKSAPTPTVNARISNWFNVRLQKMAITIAVVFTVLLTSGTSLVQASSAALPGDNLYTVKRGWEGIQLLLVINENNKQNLEKAFDEERIDEIQELYDQNRFEQVRFSGILEKIDGEYWTISGLIVKVEDEKLGGRTFNIGDFVEIVGETDDGIIEVEQIVLSSGSEILSQSTLTPAPFVVPTISSFPTSDFSDFEDDSLEIEDEEELLEEEGIETEEADDGEEDSIDDSNDGSEDEVNSDTEDAECDHSDCEDSDDEPDDEPDEEEVEED